MRFSTPQYPLSVAIRHQRNRLAKASNEARGAWRTPVTDPVTWRGPQPARLVDPVARAQPSDSINTLTADTTIDPMSGNAAVNGVTV
jgi:hypothetical protein